MDTLRLAGHVDTTGKTILYQRIEENRPRSRLKIRLKDRAEKDLQRLNMLTTGKQELRTK